MAILSDTNQRTCFTLHRRKFETEILIPGQSFKICLDHSGQEWLFWRKKKYVNRNDILKETETYFRIKSLKCENGMHLEKLTSSLHRLSMDFCQSSIRLCTVRIFNKIGVVCLTYFFMFNRKRWSTSRQWKFHSQNMTSSFK